MIDTRAVGQEVQEQVVAAARKGRQRVTATAKNVTATAQMIRPQLPSLPAIRISGLPTPAQLRDKAPTLIAKLPTADQLRERTPGFVTKLPAAADQLREKAPTLLAKLPTANQLREKAPAFVAKLPTPDQLRAGAEEFTGQVLAVRRQVTGQVRTIATPLAKQAAAAFAQAGSRVTQRPASVIAAPFDRAEAPAEAAPSKTEASKTEAAPAKPVSTAKTSTAKTAAAKTGTAKSKTAQSTKPTAAKPATAKPAAAKPRSTAARKPGTKADNK